LALTDIAFASNLAKMKNGECLVFVDNTFMGPVFQSPFLHGADVVLYSASMFIGGHSDLNAGVALTNSEDLIYKIDGFRTILGPVISPDVTWMLTRSLETLWMRMTRQAQKAEKVAAALAGHPHVAKVFFPGHFSSETNSTLRDEKSELWERQCTGTGSMITIVVRPNTRQAAYSVLNGLEVAHLAVSLGGTETLAEHPRSMTHSNMRAEDLDSYGISEGMIRISVGLESSKDLIKDFLSALDRIIQYTVVNDDVYEFVCSC
jgi:methionine-gamma-lyase